MTLLDRFRAQPQRQKHPDPAVRLAYVAEIPLDAHDEIFAIATEDEDPKIRRAAVSKLMDPGRLARIARDDRDDDVRNAASSMLRDIALEAFEGTSEAESLDAVDAIVEPKLLAQIAKSTNREIVALRAISRINEGHALGSIARHAVLEGARRSAFDLLRERGDHAQLTAVAMNGEHKDTAVAAVDLMAERADLEAVALRAKHKSASKRARALMREADERSEQEAKASAPADADVVPSSPSQVDVPEAPAEPPAAETEEELRAREEADRAHARAHEGEQARATAAVAEAAQRAAERRQVRLTDLLVEATGAAADSDLGSARKRFGIVRREWKDLTAGVDVEPGLSAQFAEVDARWTARDAEAREADARARREALARLQHLLGRAEPLSTSSDASLKAADRALREVRAAIGHVPPLPSKQDYDDVMWRLKAAQTALTAKVQELGEAADWQRWANAGVQEELCAKMEALAAVEDPEAIAREMRVLQQRWREVAEVPRARADELWRRFKTAHDAVWPKCEAHFAAQTEERGQNLAKKTALCERAEALADSTSWIETAEELKKLQAEWKTIGPVSRGREKAMWDRFRVACDRFFTRRHEDLARRKAVWAENFAKKEALAVKAEELAQSSDWEHAAAEIKRLQNEWRTIGPVKKSRSEAIWQRFRAAGDAFHARYAQRHDVARAERIAAREAICAELEALAQPAVAAAGDVAEGASLIPGPELLAKVRSLRTKMQHEIAGRGVDPANARALDDRFAAAFASVIDSRQDVFAGTDLDPEANRKRLEALVQRMEQLAGSIESTGSAGANDASLSPTTRLAAMLKEALAANTIGGKAEDSSRLRAAAEEVRQAQASWSRIGPVPDPVRRPLVDRFQRACRKISERAGGVGKTGGPGR